MQTERHENRAQTVPAGELDRGPQLHLVAMAERVGVVDEQDGVADDDAGQHDDADVGLHAERRVGEEQRADDADGRQRDREHDDERVAQRLVLRRHHRVDEDDREDEHELQLAERLGLFLDLVAEADREALRHLRSPAAAPERRPPLSLSVVSTSAFTR